MSYSKRNSLSSDHLAPEMYSTEYHNTSLPTGLSTMTLSRSSSPSSIQTSSASISNSELQRDSVSSSTSRSLADFGQNASSPLRQNSTDSCDEHACSRCRLSEEEHRRIKAERRKEQNRASQRRFRAKKENEIRGAADQVASLESMIQDLQKHNMELGHTNAALMARLAELENHHSYSYRPEDHSGGAARCSNCHKTVPSNSSADVIDFFWPVDNAENQHPGQAGVYLPLFDHELLPFEA